MNSAVASWLALRCRVQLERGQKVLNLGATGNSGPMAVQIARHLGASQFIAAGRDAQRLAKLPAHGATEIMPLGNAGPGSGLGSASHREILTEQPGLATECA
ncbi:MAG: hypothetical protein IT359_10045 [Gemmatimonadaceae bacterium]|nr:hypothetical protein [Gemmatimonadaceae bacterium]